VINGKVDMVEVVELIAKIEAAFAARPYPGDDQLVADATDGESAEIAEAFRGLHWSEPSPEMLEYHYSALTFFTAAAWRYYVPAFMLAFIEHPGENIMDVTWLRYGLLPPVVRVEQRRAEEVKGSSSIETLGLSPEETERLRTVREQSIKMVERQRDRTAEAEHDAYAQTQFEAKMSGLTAQEKSVIREFLEYLQARWPEDDDVRLALGHYWQQF
jgi:signal transduction histidine kinase